MNDIDRTAIQLIADTIHDNIDRVAAASHRPENVTRLWQDANARYLMAEAIVMALAPTPENVECQTCDGKGYIPDDTDNWWPDCPDCTPETTPNKLAELVAHLEFARNEPTLEELLGIGLEGETPT